MTVVGRRQSPGSDAALQLSTAGFQAATSVPAIGARECIRTKTSLSNGSTSDDDEVPDAQPGSASLGSSCESDFRGVTLPPAGLSTTVKSNKKNRCVVLSLLLCSIVGIDKSHRVFVF